MLRAGKTELNPSNDCGLLSGSAGYAPPEMVVLDAAWEGATVMAVESSGHSRGNPRLYELIENAPKTGKSPTVWAFPQLVDYLKVAAQPVQGPWPPHQQPRPDPDADSMPVAIPDPESARRADYAPGAD